MLLLAVFFRSQKHLHIHAKGSPSMHFLFLLILCSLYALPREKANDRVCSLRDFCQTDTSGEKLLKAATQQLHLSARAYCRGDSVSAEGGDIAEGVLRARPIPPPPLQFLSSWKLTYQCIPLQNGLFLD